MFLFKIRSFIRPLSRCLLVGFSGPVLKTAWACSRDLAQFERQLEPLRGLYFKVVWFQEEYDHEFVLLFKNSEYTLSKQLSKLWQASAASNKFTIYDQDHMVTHPTLVFYLWSKETPAPALYEQYVHFRLSAVEK